MNFDELDALAELSSQLTAAEIKRIKVEIGMPVALCEDTTQVTEFLYAVKGWDRRNPYQFYQTLNNIRPELTTIACKVKWLCTSAPSGYGFEEKELNIKSLINLLSAEITKSQWLLIYMNISSETRVDVGFEIALKMLLEKRLIQRDLKTIKQILRAIQRYDVIEKLQDYHNIFNGMEEDEFTSKFKIEISQQAKEIKQWEQKLKDFSKTQYRKVKQMIGNEESVNLAYVFVELTILKQIPKEINIEDETTYNEIAYLRKIANKEVKIKPVDFTEELTSYKPTESEIWCLIGNPGCGKTFLAKRTALRFSSNELTGIQYSISIPCRNTDWHSMESTRYEEEKKVESEYIQKWLCLGLPVGPSWTIDLAKHLNESNGEGLLLIIDGLDEFTKKVPFGKTFLCLLLTRQSLTKSTIILTSRPGAWTDISSSHELKIDRYYQVLGFSPENRDLYFKKQITNESKLKACWELMERHDEMKQLSLIPVNASLFAALLKGEDSTSINTLTKLYYELTLYMIRRELSRMGLQEFSRVSQISKLHEDILDCLYRIAFIAFLGVANRDLASEENVPLFMGQEEYTCQCLGLAHEHYRKDSIGLMKKVWTFAHLTMQEFVSALWLEHTTWTEQCYSVRYISNSMSNFSLFRMVVRFLCGLLSDKAAAILSIISRYLTPQPIQLIDLPMSYQLKFDISMDIRQMQHWFEFTEIYFQLFTILHETNSDSVSFWFNTLKKFFPTPLYLYIRHAVFPNEWICFIQSLKLVCHVQLIYIDISRINQNQFKSFMQEMRLHSVNILTLYFSNKDSATILSYTQLIRHTEMKSETKMNIELNRCDFSDEADVMIPPKINEFISGLRLYENKNMDQFLQELTSQLSAIQNLSVEEFESNYDILVPALCQAVQLRVLHLYGIPENHLPNLLAVLPQLPKLQEVGLGRYSLMPAITNLSSLTYLKIEDETTEHTTLSDYLLQIINRNTHSLRGMELQYLHRIGLDNWGLFVDCLELCTNLAVLKLWTSTLPSNDDSDWYRAFNKMKLLVELIFYDVSLYDTGFLSLCQGLIYHAAIRSLDISRCELTPLSCSPLTYLIPTISQIDTLTVEGLIGSNGDQILLLEQTADKFSIELELS